jgi:acyl-homoserine-lactone acylase
MRRAALFLLLLAPCLNAEKVRILRDDFGVPHIFASTPAGMAFGAGYAQAEDRLEELLRNYRRADGTMAEAFGPDWVQHDYRQRLWQHAEIARRNYAKLSPAARSMCEGFTAGVLAYMGTHPGEVPSWAPPVEPWQIVALSRFIIWGWMENEVGGKLLRAGIKPDPAAYRGSNEWALAPSRTSMRAPIALIDPHLSWYGEFRFYEIRMYAGTHAISGASIVGLPFPALGHSRWASVAMTTGGPDTSDVYEEQIANGKYKFGDKWVPLDVRHEKIGVNVGGKVQWKNVDIESTRHGPIVAHKDGKAYSAAIPYAGEFRVIEESWAMMNARNLTQMKQALAGLQFMPQNIMVATVDGDIYYVRNGRVPVRPKGCDSSRPMPGTGACEWQGIHPFADLAQAANPPQGYMQACNSSPEWLTKANSPLPRSKYSDRFELYNAPPGPAHQRAAMVLDLLDKAKNVSAEQAMRIAFATDVYGAETWQERVRKAVLEPSGLAQMIVGWNRRADAESRPALGFYLFKLALGRPGAAVAPSDSLTDAGIRDALAKAEARLNAEYAPDAAFGSVFRVGREGGSKTYPVGGGSLTAVGMATPRAISYEPRGKEWVGVGGQTSTQVVVLSKPVPRSWMVIPLGESDHRSSPHWDDQAEKLFSRSLMKSTYFLNPAALKKHVERTEEFEYRPK